MKVGFYLKNPRDFNTLRVPFFKPHRRSSWGCHGCGANTLVTITGDSPYEFGVDNRRGHFSDKFMVAKLRERGCRVVPLTVCEVSMEGYENNIKPEHLIMLKQIMLKNEASWTITHDSHIIHNFVRADLSPFEFLNRPILSAYLISHPAWKKEQSCPTTLTVKK